MENNIKKVLYIGSGNSARLVKELDLSEYITVCVNNAWRIFDDMTCDYWVHSGDFPKESSPTTVNYKHEISYKEYEPAINKLDDVLHFTDKPVFAAGYTIFFQGLYWIFHDINPDEIYTLGFDHDYNTDKVKKWEDLGRPNPQNQFLKADDESITEWSNRTFAEYTPDFFYGHGTPDPMRLGGDTLLDKFTYAEKNAEILNIKLYNASSVTTGINTFEKVNLNER